MATFQTFTVLGLMFTFVLAQIRHNGQPKRYYIYYSVSNSKASYNVAKEICNRSNGNLAIVRSSYRHTFLTNQLKKTGNLKTEGTTYFIGLTRENGSEFIWADGKSLRKFNKWDGGRPNVKENEKCVVLRYNQNKSVWNTVSCKTGSKHKYICQQKVRRPILTKRTESFSSSRPTNITASLTSLGRIMFPKKTSRTQKRKSYYRLSNNWGKENFSKRGKELRSQLNDTKFHSWLLKNDVVKNHTKGVNKHLKTPILKPFSRLPKNEIVKYHTKGVNKHSKTPKWKYFSKTITTRTLKHSFFKKHAKKVAGIAFVILMLLVASCYIKCEKSKPNDDLPNGNQPSMEMQSADKPDATVEASVLVKSSTFSQDQNKFYLQPIKISEASKDNDSREINKDYASTMETSHLITDTNGYPMRNDAFQNNAHALAVEKSYKWFLGNSSTKKE